VTRPRQKPRQSPRRHIQRADVAPSFIRNLWTQVFAVLGYAVAYFADLSNVIGLTDWFPAEIINVAVAALIAGTCYQIKKLVFPHTKW